MVSFGLVWEFERSKIITLHECADETLHCSIFLHEYDDDDETLHCSIFRMNIDDDDETLHSLTRFTLHELCRI